MNCQLNFSTRSVRSAPKLAKPPRKAPPPVFAVEPRLRVTSFALASLVSFVLLACQNLLEFGPEPTLRISDEEASGGSAGRASLGIGGKAQGGRPIRGESDVAGTSGVGSAQMTTSVGGSATGDRNSGGAGGGTQESGVAQGGAGGGTQESGVAQGGAGGGTHGSGVAQGGTTYGSGSGGSTSAGTGGSEPNGGTTGQVNSSGGSTSSTGGGTSRSAAEYSCSVDVVLATSDCKGPIQMTQLGALMGSLRVNMTGYEQLHLRVEVTDPTGYILDIGDSPCVDGGGGDCGWYSNDAELEVRRTAEGGIVLSTYASDLVPGTSGSVVLGTMPGFFGAAGSSVRTLTLADGMVCVDGGLLCWASPALLRIDAPDAEDAIPDVYWYIGLNRVVWNPLRDPPRIGSGVRKASFKLQ